MAESKRTMARLDRLEAGIVHVKDVLVLQSERLDGLRDELRAVRDEMRAVHDETRVTRDRLTDRLDRLIAITTKERTAEVDRLANIERRLARLEERVGS